MNLSEHIESVVASILARGGGSGGGGKNVLTTAVDVIRVCMEEVEKLPGGLHGSDKLAIVQAVLSSRDQLARLGIPEAVLQAIDLMVANDLVKPTIDVICLASQGKVDVNKTVACCTAAISAWFSKRAQAASTRSNKTR